MYTNSTRNAVVKSLLNQAQLSGINLCGVKCRAVEPGNPFSDWQVIDDEPVIYAYTRRQALADGEQVDANVGELAEVTRQHYKFPVYMTRSVYNVIERAVKNTAWANYWCGVWNDICWMSIHGRTNQSDSRVEFDVIIRGAESEDAEPVYHLLAECGPKDIDDPQPVITIMFPHEA